VIARLDSHKRCTKSAITSCPKSKISHEADLLDENPNNAHLDTTTLLDFGAVRPKARREFQTPLHHGGRSKQFPGFP